jgi:hypothetical protein
MEAIDAINAKHGRWTAVAGTQGFRREWRMPAGTASRPAADRVARRRRPGVGFDR